MKTWPQAVLLSPRQRGGTTSQKIPTPTTCPWAPFTVETALLTKLILTCWGLDLLTKGLCVHLIMFSYLFSEMSVWGSGQCWRSGLTSPPHQELSSCAITVCWGTRQGFSPAEKQLHRIIVHLQDPSIGLGKGQHSQWKSIRGNNFLCVWKMPN